MCLFITANPQRGARSSRELARAITEESGLNVSVGQRMFSKVLHFTEDQGCSCSMMSDSADWNSEVWALRAEVLPSLAKAVSALASHHKSGFTFEAMWAGDKPQGEQEITIEELLKAIEQNRVRNKTTYRVLGAA